MEREIKFRVWADNQKKMVYGDMLFINDVSDAGSASLETTIINLQQECVLMQYTGLKDRNGKEIYEGDIVNVYKGTSVNYTGVIEWIIDNATFMAQQDKSTYPVPMINSHVVFEIIGNIYENHDLLK